MAETPPIVFIDTETLGLEPERHAIWEVGLIARIPGEAPLEREWTVQLAPDEIAAADPTALRLNRFYERYDDATATPKREVALEIAKLTAGAWLVGAVPSFDALRIESFLRYQGLSPAWHHRLVCVETLAAARLGVRPGWDPKKLSEMLGVERPDDTKHSAMADARWAMRMFDAVYSAPAGRSSTKAKAPVPEAQPPTDDVEEVVEQATDRPPTHGEILDQLRENGGECEECKTPVSPEHAVLTFTMRRRVLCINEENGGCNARYATGVSA